MTGLGSSGGGGGRELVLLAGENDAFSACVLEPASGFEKNHFLPVPATFA